MVKKTSKVSKVSKVKKTIKTKKQKTITTKDFQFFSFSKMESEMPIFSEIIGRKDWILYGVDNLYNKFLNDLLANSSKHNAAIDKKTKMSAGKGWEEVEELKDFIDNTNGKETLNDIVIKNSQDLNVSGMWALIITWSKDKQSIARIKYINSSKLRIKKQPNDGDKSEVAKNQREHDLEYYYVSADWSNETKPGNEPKLFQEFSEEFKKETTQILFVRKHTSEVDFYALPDYYSARKWIKLDAEIVNFHLSSVENGFTPGMIINFKQGIPSDQEMKKINRRLEDAYAGTSKASKIFSTFTDEEGTAPEFIPITLNNSDQRFLNLEELIMQNIITVHGASAHILGVQTAGKLGSSSEIIEAQFVFQKEVIDEIQIKLERVYNRLAKINKLPEELKLVKVSTFPSDVVDSIIKNPTGKMEKNDVNTVIKQLIKEENESLSKSISKENSLYNNEIKNNINKIYSKVNNKSISLKEIKELIKQEMKGIKKVKEITNE